jgi:hypothetical protein
MRPRARSRSRVSVSMRMVVVDIRCVSERCALPMLGAPYTPAISTAVAEASGPNGAGTASRASPGACGKATPSFPVCGARMADACGGRLTV